MTKKGLITMFFTAMFLLAGLFGPAVDAKSSVVNQAMGQVGAAMEQAEVEEPSSPQAIIVDVIRRILTLTGALFMILMVYGGYMYVTAHGEDEQIEKGTKIIRAAIVGIVIVLLSYSITMFVGSRAAPLVTEGEEVAK